MPDPMFKKAAGHIPKWAYYASAGAAIAGIAVMMKQKQAAPAVDDGSGDPLTGDPLNGVGSGAGQNGVVSQMPGSVIVQQPGGEAVSSELNTDIPEATLSALTDVFGTFAGESNAMFSTYASESAGVLAQNQQSQNAVLQTLAEAGTIPASHNKTGGVVTVQAPPHHKRHKKHHKPKHHKPEHGRKHGRRPHGKKKR